MKKRILTLFLSFAIFLFVVISPGNSAAQSELTQKIQELADKLTSSVSGKVIDVRDDVVYINLGEKDSVFEGSVYEVVRPGDVMMLDGKPYYEEEPVGKIQVSKVRRNMSLANPIAALMPIRKGDKVYQQNIISPEGRSDSTGIGQGLIAVPSVDLKSVHRRLKNGGFSPGHYDERNLTQLSEAIKRFQKFAHLTVNGQLDAATWAKMKFLYDPLGPDNKKATHPFNPSSQVPGVLKVNKIVLTEFPHGNSFNDFTKNVYEGLSVYFIQKGYQVVERSQLQKILNEQNISYSGLVDISTAQKLGKLLGSEAALLGTITDVGNNAVIRARLVDVEKGVAMTAAEVEIRKAPDILALMREESRISGTAVIGGGSVGNISSKGFPVVQQAQGFSFEIQSCELSGQQLMIHIYITSNEKDKDLAIYNNYHTNRPITRIVDDNGVEHWPEHVLLAGKKIAGNKSPGYVTALMVTDVPTMASLRFGNMHPEAKIIPRFDLGCWTSEGEQRFSVQFRSFPVIKTQQ